MTDSFKVYLRVGGGAVAVFVALLLAGVARGEGPASQPSAIPTPEQGYRDGPRLRERFDGPRRRGGAVPDLGEGVPGGGSVPDSGGAAPMPDFGGGATPDPGDTTPAPGNTDGATT